MSCNRCKVNLAGLEYVEKDNKDLCLNCFNALYGKTCRECHKPIPAGSKYAKNDDKYWHKDCFRCAVCKKPLTSYKTDNDDRHYCVSCYNEKFVNMCVACQKSINMNEQYADADGQLFHKDCFRCSSKTCGKTLDDGFIPKNNKFYCEDCYQEIMSTQTLSKTLTYRTPVFTGLLQQQEANLGSIAKAHKVELKISTSSTYQELLIPKIPDKGLSTSNDEQSESAARILPNIVMNAKLQNNVIKLKVDDLSKQNVDAIVVCFTSKTTVTNILQQAGATIEQEYSRHSSSASKQTSPIETNGGNLNCKSILFASWTMPSKQDPKTLYKSINELVMKVLQYIFQYRKTYKTIAFSAIDCEPGQCPSDVLAKAMIETTVAKLKDTALNVTISFIISPHQRHIHQAFASSLASVQKPTDAYGSVQCEFSKLTITLTGKREDNLVRCQSAIETNIDQWHQTETRRKEENLDLWTQPMILTFYEYCLDHYVWPTINIQQRQLVFTGDKSSIDDAIKYFLELTTFALRQTHLNAVSRDVVWEYQTNATTWQSYSYKCNAEIEYAFSVKKEPIVTITNEQSETCFIDFNQKKETCDRRIRIVRRRTLSNYNVPSTWQVQTSNCCRFLLNEQSQEFKNIQSQFNETMKGNYTCIKTIERIQNQRWYIQYAAHRQEMFERLKENTEKHLFHGCSADAAVGIIQECFNRSYAGVNGTVYGHGAYFATNARYSHSFTRPNQNNERYMFVVSVLVGKSITGDTSMKVPPKGYDSTTDDNEIFVVYHDAQAYADYLINYE